MLPGAVPEPTALTPGRGGSRIVQLGGGGVLLQLGGGGGLLDVC